MITGHAEVECPFCHKMGVKAFYKPSYLQARTSRISAGAKITYHRVPESYEIQGDCPHCGAKEKDIQKWYDGEYREKKLSHKELVERIKKSGLPTKIEFKVK